MAARSGEANIKSGACREEKTVAAASSCRGNEAVLERSGTYAADRRIEGEGLAAMSEASAQC